MTPQEKKINDIAEALIAKFQKSKRLEDWGGMDYYVALDCAIECQREVLKQLEKVKCPFFSDAHDENILLINEAQQVLTNLENRLK